MENKKKTKRQISMYYSAPITKSPHKLKKRLQLIFSATFLYHEVRKYNALALFFFLKKKCFGLCKASCSKCNLQLLLDPKKRCSFFLELRIDVTFMFPCAQKHFLKSISQWLHSPIMTYISSHQILLVSLLVRNAGIHS